VNSNTELPALQITANPAKNTTHVRDDAEEKYHHYFSAMS
jgi:hypothetical protein